MRLRGATEVIPASVMTDVELHTALCGLAYDFHKAIGSVHQMSCTDGVFGDKRWLHPIPSTVKTHIWTMFNGATDAFAVAAGGLQGWASAATLGQIRNVAESLVLVKWLLDTDDDVEQHRRAYALTKKGLNPYGKHKSQLEEVADGSMQTLEMAERIGVAADKMKANFEVLQKEAGISACPAPKNPQLFAKYLPEAGGYLLFAAV